MQTRQVPISIAARLIYHLGEQLISDELVALLELIKNAYDADATRCEVKIDSKANTPYGVGSIVIQDNGNGMLPYTVENDFLRLATDYKKINKVSPYYKRRTLGEKGLGRLSYQRLGRFIRVRTVPRVDRLAESMRPEDEQKITRECLNCIDITMDWDGFSDDDGIEKVFATVEEKRENGAKYGTTITIQGIRNTNFWELNKEKRRRLQDEILALINPFIEAQSNAAFYLKLDVNGEEFMIDSIDETIVDRLSDVSGHFSFNGKTLTVTAEFKEKYIGRLKKRYLDKMEENAFTLIENRFDPSAFENKKFSVDLDTEDAWAKTCQLSEHSVSLVDGKPAIDFAFDGNVYIVDKTTANRADIDEDILEKNQFVHDNFQRVGKLWDRIAGVYMYRDRFRILPYGKSDWLDFTKRSQKGKATVLKQGNVSGYVRLQGEKSDSIREQTNRQGILEDENGANFLLMLNKIVIERLFAWDVALRGQFTMPKEEKDSDVLWTADRIFAFQKIIQPEEAYEKAEKELETAVSQVKETSRQYTFFDEQTLKQQVGELTESVQTLRKATDELQADYQQRLSLANGKISEFEEIVPLIGQTMIIETTTHELHRIYSGMAQSAHDLAQYSKEQDPPAPRLAQIALTLRGQVSEFDLQMNHLLPTQRYRLKDIKEINVKNFLQEQYVKESAVSRRLKKEKITCVTRGNTFQIHASVGNLIVIFDNLVMNSEYWMDKDGIEDKKIFFECLPGNIVRAWDSGKGVAKEIENRLFEPFRTMKLDGRGLGLYIVQELLFLMNADIALLNERNSLRNRYKFEIAFH